MLAPRWRCCAASPCRRRRRRSRATSSPGAPAAGPNRSGGIIAALGGECGLTLNVQESAGGVENMNAVRDRRRRSSGSCRATCWSTSRPSQARTRSCGGRRRASGSRSRSTTRRCTCWRGARSPGSPTRGEAGGDRRRGSGTRLTADLSWISREVAPAERAGARAGGRAGGAAGGRDRRLLLRRAGRRRSSSPDRIDPAAFHLLPLTDPVLAAVYTPAEVAAGTIRS